MISFIKENQITSEIEKLRGPRVRGSGGGGKGGGGAASNDANTMRTKGRARMIEAISEGEIEGLVDGERSIFFDQTPIKNQDGTYNFKNVIWSEHKGTADDGYFNGHAAVETPVGVEVQVKASTGAVTRTIVDENADAIRVLIRVPALFLSDDKGGLKRASVSYAIDVRSYNGSWNEVVVNNIINEKAMSPFQVAHRIDLPQNGSPWDVRVRRLSPDATDDKLQNETYWEGYVILVEGKFTYPNTAAIAMEVDAEQMGSSVPARSYHVRGLKLNVPSNYNPITRAYTGIWDGTFKIAWTNNPAWIFYDLLINDRYGLGEFIQPAIVDKWSLYTIAQYCDQLVPSGFKDSEGESVFEPRFTYNGVINTRDEAYFVLQSITTAWRGMAYWALGKVFATADMPADPAQIVTPANVIGGEFDYAGTAIKARHSVVIVKWNNPDDFYRADTEIVIDPELLHKYGWRDKTVQLRGCTSRGLAHRYGKWIIDTEQHETETLTYAASWDHAEIRPGAIIAVSDPKKAKVRAGGRITLHNDLEITLDGDFLPTVDQTYNLMLTLPSGKVEIKPILAFLASNKVRVSSAFSETAMPNAVWSITGTDITPRNYRVLNVEEAEPNIFKITALFHDPNKFARIEQDIIFEPLPYERAPNVTPPPENVQVVETGYVSNNQQIHMLSVSWSPPVGSVNRGYLVAAETPSSGLVTLGMTQNVFFEMQNTESGTYKFYVQTIGMNGVLSQPAEFEFEAVGPEGYPVPTVTDIELVDNPASTNFTGRDVRIRWKNNFANQIDGDLENAPSPHYSANTVKVYNSATGELLRSETVIGSTYTYDFLSNKNDNAILGHADPCRSVRFDVTVSDVFGRTSAVTSKTFANPVPIAIAPTYQVLGGNIFLSYEKSEDPDFAGVLVLRSTSSGILTSAVPYYDGIANPLTILGDPETTYYFRIAAYDAFGKSGLNWSSEFSITTLSDGADTEAPDTPVGLAATSALMSDGRAKVTYTWTANSETDLAGYELEIKETGGNYVGYPLFDNRHEVIVLPGTVLLARIRALDKAGNRSPYSSPDVSHTATKDTTAPAVPTGWAATAGFGMIWLAGAAQAEADFHHFEIYEGTGTGTTPSGWVATYTTASTAFVRSGYAAGTTRSFWIRAVDTSGNASGWSGRVFATTTAIDTTITTAKLAGLVDKTSFAAGITGVEVFSTLPTTGNFEGRQVSLTTDGKVYRYHSGDWTTAVPAVDVTGQLTNTQIAAIAATKITGQVVDAQIAAMAASKVTGTLTNSQIADLAAAKLTGTISSAQIADAAVTLSKFATGTRPIEIVATLPATGNVVGRTVVLTTDGKLYRWTGSAWTASVPAADITGTLAASQIAALEASKITGQLTDSQIAAIAAAKVSGQLTNSQIADIAAGKITGQVVASQIADASISTAKFAAGLRPVEIVATLPSTGNVVGRTVVLTTDNKLYRWTGSAWTAAVASTDITGQVTAAQIAALEASKITGQLSDAQIAAVAAAKLTGTISTTQIADAAITAAKLTSTLKAVETVATLPGTPHVEGRMVYLSTDDKLYRNTGSGWIANVAADDVTGQLTNAQLADIAAAKITGTISSTQLADAAVTTAKFASGIRPVEWITGSTLPGTPHIAGRVVYLQGDGKIYRNNGTGWTAAVPAADITGQLAAAQIAALEASKITGQLSDAQIAAIAATKLTGTISSVQIADAAITTAKFASGIRPVETVSTLPGTPHVAGRMVYLTTDAKLYRNNGTGWIATIAASDITGTLTSAQIAALDAAKLTGQITSTQITDGAISTPKLAAGSVSTAKLAAAAVTANEIAAGAITTPKLAAAAVTANELAANSVVAGKIAAAAVSADQIAAGAVLASKIVVADFNNLTGDADLQDAASWLTGNGWSFLTDGPTALSSRGAGYYSANTGGSYGSAFQSKLFPVEGGAKYFASFELLAGAAPGLDIWGRIELYDRNQVELPAGADDYRSITVGTLATGTVQIISNIVTIPETAYYARVRCYPKSSVVADGYVGAIIVRRATSSELIVDGAITTDKLTANAVTTAKLAAGAVTADTIGAGAITTAKILAGAVTADQIGANAVTAVKLAANSVIAGKIAAGIITATEIASGAITTPKLAAGAVTANELAANSVIAGKIAAGSISATEIAAGAIVASKLFIGDMTTLVPDADYRDIAMWSTDSGGTLAITTTTDANAGTLDGKILKLNRVGSVPGSYDGIRSSTFSIQNGRPYALRGNVWANNTASIKVRLLWLNSTGSASGLGASESDYTFPASGWLEYAVNGVAPAGACQARVYIFIEESSAATSLLIGKISVVERVTGALVVDGTITTTNLVAEAITTDKLAASAVTTAKLATGAVTADTIAANAITTAKIAASAITAAQIATGAITADKVAAGAITAAAIAAGTITSNEIAANAITASKISIGDFENRASNPNFEDTSGWTLTTGASIITDAPNAFSGTRYLQLIAPSTGIVARNENTFPISSGQQFTISASVKSTGTPNINLLVRIRCMTAKGSGTATSVQLVFTPAETAAGYLTKFVNVTIPDGYSWAWVDVIPSAAMTTGAYYVGAVSVLQRTTGELIVDGAISTNHLTAASITTAKIATGAVVADTIAANAITTAKIAANAVTAAQIAAGTITANEIASGAITTAKLAASAVTANEIAANAITTAKLAAGAVTATQIAAGAVTATKLLVGDNNNIYPDPDMIDPAFYSLASGVTLVTTGYENAGRYRLRFAANAADTDAVSGPITVEPGVEYYISAMLGREDGTAGTVQLRINRYSMDAAGALTLIDSPVALSASTLGVNYRSSASFTTTSACRRIRLVFRRVGGGDGLVTVGQPIIQKKATGELIVDGVITAAKLAAESIQASKLAVLATNVVNPVSATGNLIGWGSVNEDGVGGDPAIQTYDATEKALCITSNANHSTRSLTWKVDRAKIYRVAMSVKKSVALGQIYVGIVATVAASAGTQGTTAGANGSSTVIPHNVGRVAGSASSNVYFYQCASGSSPTDYVDLVAYIIGTARDVSDCPAHVMPASGTFIPYVKMQEGAEYAALRLLNWTNAGTSTQVWFKNVAVTEVGTGQIVADNIVSNAITTAKIAANAVTAAQIAAGTITANEIAASAITTAKINAGAVVAASIATGAIDATKIAAGAVVAGKIAADAVTSTEIAANSIITGKIAAGAVTATEIATGAITTIKLAASAVTANEIASNAVTAVKVSAGAIETAKLAAGAVTAEKLSVGSGQNLLNNTTFQQGLDTWYYTLGAGMLTAATSFALRPAGSSWAGANYPTLAMRQTDGTSTGYHDVRWKRPGSVASPTWNDAAVPVTPGQTYEASFQYATHRCTAELRIEWRNAAGNSFYSSVTAIPTNQQSSVNPDTWVRAVVRGVAPADAVGANIHIRKLATTAGQVDSYLFIHKPMFCKALINAAEPTEWSEGGTTQISGGGIVTGSIQTDHIAASAVVANSIAAGAITTAKLAAGAVTANEIAASTIIAGNIAAGAITTAKIAANAVTANEVAANAITSDKILANAITTAKLAAGAVTADQIAAGSIATRHLLVTDTTNLLPDNQLQDINSWPGHAGTAVVFSTASSGFASKGMATWTRTAAATGYEQILIGVPFPVKPGEQYRGYCQLQNLGSDPIPGVLFRLIWLDSSGAQFAPSVYTDLSIASVAGSTIQEFSRDYTPDARAAMAMLSVYVQRTGMVYPASLALGGFRLFRKNTGELTVDGTITGTKLAATGIITATAQINDAIITDAKIANLSAAKLTAGSALAGTITVSGTALSTVTSNAATGAQDPATRINAGVTKIDPGSVLISGSTSLASWRLGSDTTKIDGGAIGANTIDANKVTIGLRGVNMLGIEFEHNKPATNQVSWTAGSIVYLQDNGTSATANITAGSGTWSAGNLYIYWVQGATTLSVTTTYTTATAANNLLLAVYRGGIDLNANYGRTVIDGSSIKTGSIDTAQLKAGSVTAAVMSVSSLSAIAANLGTITAGYMSGPNMVVDLNNGKIVISD